MAKRNINYDHPDLLNPEKIWKTEGLFSDHYLKTKLDQNDWWPDEEAVEPLWKFCRDLYPKRYLPLVKNNEAFTRQEIINPILEKLGFAWTDNLGIPDQDSEPDYVLFASQAEKESVLDKDKATRYRTAVALLEAKKFQHPLSQVSKTQQRYPHKQIREYLQDAQVLPWGVLTNGNEWRLYSRETRPQDYFAIDFDVAIQSIQNFKIFVAFFSPVAFQRDAQNKCRLDQVREQALSAQSQLEDDIRKRVFTILAKLANGFASRSENGLTDEDLSTLYQNCLIYLYRLLFILYAEGRRLLPVWPRSRRYYRDLSIIRLLPQLSDTSNFSSRTRTRLGEDILELFRLINGNDEKKNKEYSVPRYNGGLFDPSQYKLLEVWNISDYDLAEVLHGLLFKPLPHPAQATLPDETVDFGDLRVQQLGSIYEGLLEYHLIRKSDGCLVLESNKAERKATGTYYTPDYIVKYIVDQTLNPLIAEIEKSETVQTGKPNSFSEAVLALNICDPAMGSGHFLVEATIYLAERIALHPTTPPLSDTSKDEEEIAYWRRRVVESCIYGVDLNPLAVELAKLSLWLTCISSDQPLNFLDPHLRVGNSLIGARLDQLGDLPDLKGNRNQQAYGDLFFKADLQKAVADTIAGIKQIEQKSSESVEAVKEKERRWSAEIMPHLAPYKHIADLWTGAFFGEMTDKQKYIETVQKILKKPQKKYPEHERLFFHWEFEFPAVFYNDDGSPKENPGFDAVVGNPPWVVTKPEIHAQEKIFFRSTYMAFEYQVDLYILFIEKAINLINKNGFASMITPNSWISNLTTKNVRKVAFREDFIKMLVIPPPDAFYGVVADSLIFIANQSVKRSAQYISIYKLSERSLDEYGSITLTNDEIREGAPFSISMPASRDLLNKIELVSIRLRKLCQTVRGVNPYDKYSGQTQEIIINRQYHSDHKKDKTFVPELRGEDIERYSNQWKGDNWISYGPWLAAPRDPEFHKGPRLLFREIIRERLVGTYITQDWIADRSLYIAKFESTTFNGFYVCSIFNSRLLGWYALAKHDQLGQFFPKIRVEHFRELPIRRIAFNTPIDQRSALLAAAKKLYQRVLSEDEPDEIMSWVAEQLNSNPERSDVVHDLLAFLAERMTAMNREKRDVANLFIKDLKDFHRIDAQTLKPKSLLNDFWKVEISDLMDHFKKNHKVLGAAGVDLGGDTKDDIRSRFDKAKSAILPLESQIAFTDRLIDQIVYKLYGLTEEEIRLVEGQ